MKILLAVDGSDYSNAAVDVVAGRPWPEGSEVKIISAAEAPYMHAPEKWVLPESSYSQLAQAVKAQAESAVREASRRLQAGRVTPLNAVVETREGHAGDVIIDEAERWGADLIVVGSHGYRAFKRFLLGSVSHAVATHAPCSVEIVRGAVAGQPL